MSRRPFLYCLNNTHDLKQNKELVFVSFKKGSSKNISLKIYTLAFSRPSLFAIKVKTHDVRPFAASKDFQGGISFNQIKSSCHWKSHNTFTNIYLWPRPCVGDSADSLLNLSNIFVLLFKYPLSVTLHRFSSVLSLLVSLLWFLGDPGTDFSFHFLRTSVTGVLR